MLDISLLKFGRWVGLAYGRAGWRSAVMESIRSMSGGRGQPMVCASIYAGEYMVVVG